MVQETRPPGPVFVLSVFAFGAVLTCLFDRNISFGIRNLNTLLVKAFLNTVCHVAVSYTHLTLPTN